MITWWSSDDECLLKQWFRITATDIRQIVLNTARWGDTSVVHSSEHTIPFKIWVGTVSFYCCTLVYICTIVCKCMTQAIGWAFRGLAAWADSRHPRRCGADKRPVCRFPFRPPFNAGLPNPLTIIIFFAGQNHENGCTMSSERHVWNIPCPRNEVFTSSKWSVVVRVGWV